MILPGKRVGPAQAPSAFARARPPGGANLPSPRRAAWCLSSLLCGAAGAAGAAIAEWGCARPGIRGAWGLQGWGARSEVGVRRCGRSGRAGLGWGRADVVGGARMRSGARGCGRARAGLRPGARVGLVPLVRVVLTCGGLRGFLGRKTRQHCSVAGAVNRPQGNNRRGFEQTTREVI